MSGGASTRVTAEKCLWREEGGGAEAAARCLAFLEEVGIEVDWIGPDDEAQLLDGLAIIGGRLLVDPETPIWPAPVPSSSIDRTSSATSPPEAIITVKVPVSKFTLSKSVTVASASIATAPSSSV